MKNIKKITGLALTLSLVSNPSFSICSTKHRISTTQNYEIANGQREEMATVNKSFVLYMGERNTGKHTTDYIKEILNINGEETYKQDKNTLYWNTKGEDIFYQGKTDKQLPIESECRILSK